MQQFFSTKDTDAADIIAMLNAGEIEFWKTDAEGTKWFGSVDPIRPIHGVPRGASAINAIATNEGPRVITCEPFATDDELDDLIAREAAGEIEQIGQDKYGRVFFVECDNAE